MTEQEVQEFLDQDEINLSEINSKNSIKSNFLLSFRNFNTISLYLSKLYKFVLYLHNRIDIERIVAEVIELLKTNKAEFIITYSLEVGTSKTQEIGGTTYRITRNDRFTVTIAKDDGTPWQVSHLIIQVKTATGEIVNPVITTFNNKITVNFIDGIANNYYIYAI